MRCLSAAGPCPVICDICRKAHQDYEEAVRSRAIDEAIRVLRAYPDRNPWLQRAHLE